MVMINSATGFRRVDLAKIALARSFGASTLSDLPEDPHPRWRMPMIIVGLDGRLDLRPADGDRRRDGRRQADGLGNRLAYYSSLIQMPQFFACIVFLALIGNLIYVTFFLDREEVGELGGVNSRLALMLWLATWEKDNDHWKEPEDGSQLGGVCSASTATRCCCPPLGGVGAAAAPARAVTGTVRWVSPRGTIEVLDDYPYWVAKKYGYFGDIETTLEPGPMDATATVKLVDQEPGRTWAIRRPACSRSALAQGIPLVSAWEMGAYDVFDFAFRKGDAPAEEPGGSARQDGRARQRRLAGDLPTRCSRRRGVDPKTIKYAEAGSGWAPVVCSRARPTPRSAGRACAPSGRGRASTSTT